MNKERQKRQIQQFLAGKNAAQVDAFTIYQWIDRCYAEGWCGLALALGPLVPPNSLHKEYHRRMDYLLAECGRNVALDGEKTFTHKGIKKNAEYRDGSYPALFAPVERIHINNALEWFSEGNEKLAFFTNASIGFLLNHEFSHVYFKTTGTNRVTLQAHCAEVVTVKPTRYRRQPDISSGKYYYIFSNLKRLENPIDVVDLRYFSTGGNLRNDVPGACVICDPALTDLQTSR